MRELEKLDLLELMLGEDAAGVFSSGAGFGAEAGGPRGDAEGEFFLGNGFVAVEIMEFNFGSWRKPKVGVLDFEKISGEFRQLARAGERRGVHQERRQDLRVTVLARVHVEKKIRERALQPRSPSFVHCKTRPRDFCCGGKIENSRAFADFPMRPGDEIEFRCGTPATDFGIVSGARANGHGGVWNVGNGKQEFALIVV